MTGKIGLVFNGVWSHYAVATAPKYRDLLKLIYIHELDQVDWKDYDALIVPFQSHQEALARQQAVLYALLAKGGKVAVFGNSTPAWLDAQWEDRPVDNYWWVRDPNSPPITETDYTHPVFTGLKPRHAGWHNHGIYSRIPPHARVLQRSAAGEIITWETTHYGGNLFVSTLDPIVEHGVQQIRHLDHFVDNLLTWLGGQRPTGPFEIPATAYGLAAWS